MKRRIVFLECIYSRFVYTKEPIEWNNKANETHSIEDHANNVAQDGEAVEDISRSLLIWIFAKFVTLQGIKTAWLLKCTTLKYNSLKYKNEAVVWRASTLIEGQLLVVQNESHVIESLTILVPKFDLH
jgi:hypothetical protein